MRQRRFWILAVLLFGSILASCCIGRYPLTLREIWEIVTGTMTEGIKSDIFFRVRLSRVLLLCLSGGALSVAGLVYQNLFQNPLVSPDVLGVSSGASAGAVTGILLGTSAAGVQFFALTGGIVTVILALILAKMMGNQRSISLILAGIVMGALADSGIMALKYAADPNRQLPTIDYWLMGSFHTIRWEDVWTILPLMVVGFLLLWIFRWKLQVMILGEEEAASLGLTVITVKLAGIFAATILVSAVVSVTGVISWIGLIVPHMMRYFFGESLRRNYALCILGGAAVLLWADTLARSLTPSEIPISILTSLIGAVFLVMLLFWRKRRGETVV